MSTSIHRWLHRLVAGDREAAAWLYDTFSPGLYHRLTLRYRHLPGVEPADLLHDAFVFFLRPDTRALRSFLAETSDGDCPAAALEKRLWDLACGLASNHRRSAWSRRAVTLGEIHLTSAERSAECEATARDALEKLDRCLEGETEEGYLYYQLRYVDGLKPRQIATVTGQAVDEVYRLRSVLDRALRRCAERLGLARS
ncbi:MAG: sigma-70 family RNA polymerase sigma factor [Acidobacteria bacterium]|nr:sigma-70 family RNA polymerase sigma factor [Acidobacteriota bacterium]